MAKTKSVGFSATVTCDECPWRMDVKPGRFAPKRFEALRSSVKQGFAPMFACHKSPEDEPAACVGYLMVDGLNNFLVRLAAIAKKFDPSRLRALGPLYPSYAEMERANIPRRRR